MQYLSSTQSARHQHTGVPKRTADTVPLGLLTAHEQHQDMAVLSVQGEIDRQTTPVLRERLLPLLEHQTGPVLVDLSEVTFMDSTGARALVETRRRLEAGNRLLAVACREGGQVRRILALVGLLDVLPAHRSRESAVISGDDVLRPEPGRDSGPSEARAPTHSLLSARQTPNADQRHS
jgi:anti-sigma B factor antagonist